MDKNLKSLGLTNLEIKVFLTLLKTGKKTAKSVSLETGIRLEAIYRLFKGLIKKGLISSFGKHPSYYQAYPLEFGIGNLLNNFQLAASGFFGKKSLAHIPAPLQLIKNREIYHQLGEKYFKQVKKEVLVIASGTGDLNPEFTKTMVGAVKSGVIYKIIALTLGEINYLQLKIWQKNGYLVRHRPGRNFNLVIYDREIVQIGIRIDEESKEKYGFIIANPDLASFMGEFFDFLWKTSKQIK